MFNKVLRVRIIGYGCQIDWCERNLGNKYMSLSVSIFELNVLAVDCVFNVHEFFKGVYRGLEGFDT